MTTKAGKDVTEETSAEEVEATEEEPAEQESSEREPAARPAKRKKRRVRVIEVIDDDDDLDDVLSAIEDEDEDDTPPPKPKPRPKPVKVTKVEEPEEEEAAPEPARTGPVPPSGPPPATVFGLGRTQAIVVVLLVALLASLAIWQWRSAGDLSAKEDAGAEAAKVASAYGDVALNYNASNYQAQMEKVQQLMGGDLLDSFKTNTLPNLGTTFKNNPQLALTSKTNQTFVGSVDDRFATVVISVDISVTSKEGSSTFPATLIRLAIGKIDGKWKVTKQYASGANDQSQSTLPNVGGTGQPSEQPKSEEPKKDDKN